MIWWQILAIMGMGMIGTLVAVTLGGWLVFKAKTITMPTPFLAFPHSPKPAGKSSYVSEFYDKQPESIFEEELSTAASRLRDQKLEHKENLNVVKGKK